MGDKYKKEKTEFLTLIKIPFFHFNNYQFFDIIYLTKTTRKKVIIKRTQDIKIFSSLNKIYHIKEQISNISREKNKRIRIKGSTIAKLLFAGMLYKEKSINQIMEKTHKRKLYKKMFKSNETIPKMHGFIEGIKDLKVSELEKINKNIIRKAKENKIYRNGTIDNLIVVGIDGTETFGSYKKNWDNCYNKKIKNKRFINGKEQIVEEEYHEQICVFARIVGKRPGVLLGYEKVTSNGNEGKQEFEPNVGIKLIQKIKKIYGNGIDVIVGDAIYLRESVIKAVLEEGYQGVFRLKDNNKMLLENANGVFKLSKAKEYKSKGKKIKYWSDNFEYYGNKVKVVKYEEYNEKGKKQEISVACTDVNMKEKTINKIIHARWGIENEGFNELKNQWNMNHCYISNEKAIDVILQMIMMSYNLWELYIYGHLHDFEKMGITKTGFIDRIKELFFEHKCKAWNYSSA